MFNSTFDELTEVIKGLKSLQVTAGAYLEPKRGFRENC